MEWSHLFTWHNETLLESFKVLLLYTLPPPKSLFENEVRTEASFTGTYIYTDISI